MKKSLRSSRARRKSLSPSHSFFVRSSPFGSHTSSPSSQSVSVPENFVQVKRCMYSTPHSSDTNVTSPRKRGSSMVSPVSSFTSRIAHSSGLSPYSNFPPSADANPLVAVFVVLLLGSVEDEIASVLLDVAEGSKSWVVGFHGAGVWRTLYHFARHICRVICRHCCCGRANCRNVNLIWRPLNVLAYNLTIIPSHCCGG